MAKKTGWLPLDEEINDARADAIAKWCTKPNLTPHQVADFIESGEIVSLSDRSITKFTAKKIVNKLSECCCHNLDEVCIPCLKRRLGSLLAEIEES